MHCATSVCVGPKAAAAGFHEPSLVFMTGTETVLTDGSGAADFLGQGSCRFALVEQRSERALPRAPKPSACATMSPPASTATTSRKAARSRSRSSDLKARSKMSAPVGAGHLSNYLRKPVRAGPDVAVANHATAVPFATCRGGAPVGAAQPSDHNDHKCCNHRADDLARRAGDRPDAAARHAGALAGSHPDRFRQGRLCAVAFGLDGAGSWICSRGPAGNLARAMALRLGCGCSLCFSRCWCRCWPAN